MTLKNTSKKVKMSLINVAGKINRFLPVPLIGIYFQVWFADEFQLYVRRIQ